MMNLDLLKDQPKKKQIVPVCSPNGRSPNGKLEYCFQQIHVKKKHVYSIKKKLAQ